MLKGLLHLRKNEESAAPAGERETRIALVDALARRIGKGDRTVPVIEGGLELLGSGLLDSLDLVEVITEVERASKRRYEPGQLDFAAGLTVDALLSAFVHG